MHISNERTKIIVWFFLFASERCSLVVASPGTDGSGLGTIGDRRSSFLGIIGSLFDGAQVNNNNNNRKHNDFGLSRSPYTRFDRRSVSRGSSELSLVDRWTRAIRSSSPEETRSKKCNNDSPYSHRRRFDRCVEEEYGYGNPDDTCLDVSLSVTVEQKTDFTAMTSPIVPLTVSFDGQTGEEFADPEMMDQLAASGLEMATREENDWIEWKQHSSTKKLLEENSGNEMAVLEGGGVMVYIGKSKQEGHGSNLPIIKTKSMLPISAEEMAELLMDSSKVKIYNKLSVGRTDVRTLGTGTKVVCNLTKPPIAKSNMVSCTLMHSRRLKDGSGQGSSYLVVSRATPGMVDDAMSDLPRNDILLGVNLLEDRGPNECIMTAVTHVYSPALPTILAKKLGVSSAINFVKDIRKSCDSVGS